MLLIKTIVTIKFRAPDGELKYIKIENNKKCSEFLEELYKKILGSKMDMISCLIQIN